MESFWRGQKIDWVLFWKSYGEMMFDCMFACWFVCYLHCVILYLYLWFWMLYLYITSFCFEHAKKVVIFFHSYRIQLQGRPIICYYWFYSWQCKICNPADSFIYFSIFGLSSRSSMEVIEVWGPIHDRCAYNILAMTALDTWSIKLNRVYFGLARFLF